MRKREFMDELKKALDGNVSTQTYYDTINYYEDYFKKQKEAGKSEEEICSSLGSARLIAKTIMTQRDRAQAEDIMIQNPLRMMAATTPAKPAEAVRRAGM